MVSVLYFGFIIRACFPVSEFSVRPMMLFMHLNSLLSKMSVISVTDALSM